MSDTMVKVRPNCKEPSCKSFEQHLEVVMPDGQVLPHVKSVQLTQDINQVTSVTVTMHCGGILPVKE